MFERQVKEQLEHMHSTEPLKKTATR
jgi:hypothetical protein